MDYRTNTQERKYNEDRQMYLSQGFSQQLYERAMRFSLLPGSHIGDYSKELLEKPSEHYEGKMPKNKPDQSSNYKFQFSVN